MSVLRLSPVCLVLILASSALSTLPYAFPDHRAAPLSFGPHLIYGSGISGGNGGLTGYSYFMKDLAGGEGDVVFVTGPNSDIKMYEEVAAVKDQMSAGSATADVDDGQKMQSDAMDSEDASKNPSIDSVETRESSAAQNQAETRSTTAKSMEGKKDSDGVIQGVFNGQLFPEKRAGFDTPYPILRLGGSALFYPQLPTSFSSFPGYAPSDYFKSQYLPFVNSYSSYQSQYNPLYPPLDTGYYNPGLFPTVYQSPIIVPASVSGSIPEKKQDAGSTENPLPALQVSSRIGEGTENSDKQTGGDSSSTEKGSELPTTTEQAVEKGTTVSETAPTTTEEVKETTTAASATTVANDAVAVE